MTRPAQPPAGSSGAFDAVSHPCQARRRLRSAIGPAGVIARALVGNDPFGRIFPGTRLGTDLFCEVAPPAGPVIERYAGVAWPGGSFA